MPDDPYLWLEDIAGEEALDEALRSGVASDEQVAAFWKRYGVDASATGVRDPYNAADAIFAAARYLQAAGAAQNLPLAIYAYNHSWSYVNSVLLRAEQ